MSKIRTPVRLHVPALLGVVALAGLGVAGCDGDAEQERFASAQVDCNALDGSVDGAVDGAVEVDGGDAGGPIVGLDSGIDQPTITSITANGSGCPNGTWTGELSADGTEALVKLNAFELEIASGSARDDKFCQLAVKVRGKAGTSYQVERVALEGVQHLDTGVTAHLETTRYFQGAPTVNDVWQVDLHGRTDAELALVSPADSELWSPCGLERDINVRINGRLRNDDANSGSGFVTLTQAHVFKLVSRACE